MTEFDKLMQQLLADHPSVALIAFSKGFARHEEARRKKDYRSATHHLHEALRYVPEHLRSKTLAEMIKSVDNPDEGRNVAAVMSRITPTLPPKQVAELLGALIIDNVDQRQRLRVATYISDTL
ncbi:MAG: hypothetical protein WAO08_10300 [Hyphomicrobiaceae bacterium]